MKKIIGWILLIILAIGSLLIVRDKNNIYNIGVKDSGIEMKIRYKGLKNAIDFTRNDNGLYVAFENKIMAIPSIGEPYTLIEDKNYNITTLECNGDKLYFVTNNEILSLDINNGKLEQCLSNLPNKGDYNKVLIRGYKEYLFISIGAATNSGVVGSDNKWIDKNPTGYDISPYNIVLNKNEKGAFVPQGAPNEDNEVIKGESIGNSSLLIYNTNTKAIETYAWGIRNIEGLDITLDGRIFATIGGYENRGLRPVENDSDYIYEIKKGYWYGFPDFSGGDPLDSPRFQGESDIKNPPLLKKYPMSPPAPTYQHNDLNSLKWIAIDDTGKINGQNTLQLYYYDSNKSNIMCSAANGVPKKLITLMDNCTVSNMKIFKDELYILDGKHGFIFTLTFRK